MRVLTVGVLKNQKRRGSRVPDDDDDEESEYFRVKPENKVVVIGQC